MKRQYLLIFLVVFLITIGIGCSPAQTPTPTPTLLPEPTLTPVPTVHPGKSIVSSKSVGCHDLGTVTNYTNDAIGWAYEVDRMVLLGTKSQMSNANKPSTIWYSHSQRVI